MPHNSPRTDIYTPLQVLVFSNDAAIRRQIQMALGRLPDVRLGSPRFRDVATEPAAMREMATGAIDLAILDAEASPAGGLGVTKQLKDELLQCPPIVVVIGRAEDQWLANWSQADAVVTAPIDPVALMEAVLPLLRRSLRY
ncbi:hypothetical protein [Mycolicibacterium sp. YH-1]|uniref:hypothetical protein n=1 Tax=Mycolicibacterium sp. YH-1 TaxID=2908837 RepID=UPI001F4C4F4C|nr:hypothetical protein [Mycolicibacterium sp. YH-1]UNB49899.1 hypothetical protein L0M16_17945 [Mycolicibacterium sp. YH-1]